jgi:flagellar biosynthetic protein FlhB
MRTGLAPDVATSIDNTLPFASAAAYEMLLRLGPLLLILLLVGLGVLYAQVGPLFTVQPLTPTLSKLNPISGFKRLLSVRSVMTAVMNAGKLLAVAAVAYVIIAAAYPSILYAFTLGFNDVFHLGTSLAFRLGLALSGIFLLLAVIDFSWQKYRHERDLRMTKEEVKDELRSMEGDPAIKRKRQQLQAQMALQRLKKAVPQADVIVTNPTHLAIAIAYNSETMIAPKVVAKGADYLAIRIRQVAQEHNIPIVERKPLARALFDTVEVGQFIPERFYRAIAEILAFVYELAGTRPAGMTRQRARV